MNKLDIGSNVGVGLGFTLMGIFISNMHIFFGTNSIFILSIFGTIFSIFGISGMLISISKGKDLDFFNDLAVAVILFVPIFLSFIFIKIFWLKVMLAILSSISFIFVGLGCQSLRILNHYLANYLGRFLIKFKVNFLGDCIFRLV